MSFEWKKWEIKEERKKIKNKCKDDIRSLNGLKTER